MRKVLTYGVLVLGAVCASAQTVKISAGGATFPDPIYEKWFSEYHKLHNDVQISYTPNGSGGGVKGVTDGTIDFGASDSPMSDAELKAAAGRGKVYQFPTVLGAVVPIYNVPGVSQELKFSGPTLAGIFLGKITKWNDKAIAADNPGVKLPGDDITVVHRSDASGTSFIFTDYLSSISPEWKSKVGAAKAVSWPAGLGGQYNPGVTGLVKQTPGSIGYVELIYALQNKMGFALMKNASGNFIKASLDSVSAAADGAKIPDDFRVSIVNAPGKDAFPISSFTWMLIPEKINDPAKAKAIHAFLAWMLTDGQKIAPSEFYAPLPQSLVVREQKVLATLK